MPWGKHDILKKNGSIGIDVNMIGLRIIEA